MRKCEALAARLRQAIQGCSVHIHGPIQAWASIEQARADGDADSAEVARLAIEACANRIAELRSQGADPGDLRIKKEELTRAFIEQLFSESDEKAKHG